MNARIEQVGLRTGGAVPKAASRNPILAEHLEESSAFGDAIDQRFCKLIYQTSPLHDIGKVAIPDFVLLKPGALTKREYEIMQTHAAEGAATLEAAISHYPHVQFLQMAHEIALCHHEKFDGSGYPNGLQGDDIPLSARIVAVADVYDALCSKRVYKAAYSFEIAREIIVEESGAHFDPKIVDAFIAAEDQFAEIRQRFQDEMKRAA